MMRVFPGDGPADSIDARMHKLAFAHLGPGCVVLDVGANCGVWSVPAAQTGATVYAFEPGPSVESLESNIEQFKLHDRIRVVRKAVSDGRAESLPQFPGVGCVTLDGFAAEAGLERIDLIKIDVEGYELSVLAGAAGVLGRFRPILMVEVHYGIGWAGTPTSLEEVAERLRGYDLDCWDYLKTIGWGGAHVLATPQT